MTFLFDANLLPDPGADVDLPPLPDEPDPPPGAIVAEIVPQHDLQRRAEVEAENLQQVVHPVLARADQYVCRSPEDYQAAADLLDELVRMEKAIDDKLGPIIDTAYRQHRQLTALRAEMKAPITQRAKAIKASAAAWRSEEDREAREEAARLAEDQRRIEQARAEQVARELAAQGQQEAAQQVIEEAKVAPPPAVHVPRTVPNVPGMVERYNYSFEIIDRDAIPDQFWIVDEKAIGAIVRAQKDACQIPGIKVIKTPATTFRRGAR